ncbi:MAG: ion channel [bacterium]
MTDAFLDEATDFQKYTASFYFSVTTITTVGYGDISAHNSLERIIAIMIEISGVVFFSIVSA